MPTYPKEREEEQHLKQGARSSFDYSSQALPSGPPMIDKIVIGPSANKQAAEDALLRALEAFKCESVEIESSEIPFRA
ncbi:hypothetical protein ACPOL_2146 [Acidisarcina polymorpha]|uniref:Uncharacterized protein n=1 Tax=Acidisarcina polymorpha TaxID=2211140 RepID=A0A2Z5FXL1_9BACT|nr:hypothetical protein [Acidisarcina polymorpha]AXC11470.1 hypothetical protein ACPOL_2146 [Acidisarcina polymorpha]